MFHLKIAAFTLILHISVLADSATRVQLEKAGFFGNYSIGVGYDWAIEHITDFSLGFFQIDHNTSYQANLAYRYSHWNLSSSRHFWQPFQIGVFATYALSGSRYFLTSPAKYPGSGYYEQTALRHGLELATTYVSNDSNVGIGYRLRILDSGFIAVYNNTESTLKYSAASGIVLQYLF